MANVKSKIYKIAVSYLENLPTQLNQSFYDDMEQVEEAAFSKYNDEFGQDIDDIKDDINQPGFIGVGIEDKGKLQGYLYGYRFIYEDNWEDYIDEMPLSFKVKNYFTINKLRKAAKNGKVLYIVNLAINDNYRILLDRLFKKFIEKVKLTDYKYIVADLLSDSARLLSDGHSNEIKEDRITRYGLKLISFGDVQDEDTKLLVLEI